MTKQKTPTVLEAAEALLAKIDDLTTEQFSRGGERVQREALRQAIAAARESQAALK